MLTNLPKEEVEEINVKFVEYSGKYPNLCRGTLLLKIDGEVYSFGGDGTDYPNRFWRSGGECHGSGCCEDEWLIDYKWIPDQLKQYAKQIDRIFNENVEYGCCGGCL